ncbi:hypothetical protein [Streptomyces sp. NPDC056132]|uniref:hypothetical protein n=1 Tax=Streptomyces sp. NPDC056132 TaxID=3345722 RepID=UPI0035DEAEFA
MTAPRTAANRTVLATAGFAMLAGGVWLATAHDPIANRLPAGWPTAASGTVLLNRSDLAQLRGHTWWVPTVTTASALATVLLAWWLFAQIRHRRRPRLALAVAGGHLRTRALEDVLVERAVALDGIRRCHARVHARRRRVCLSLHVWLTPDTTPDQVVRQLTTLIREAGHAAAPYEIDTRLRMSHVTHRAHHVR